MSLLDSATPDVLEDSTTLWLMCWDVWNIKSSSLSIKTGLSQLSFITDADKEFDRMLEEKQIIEQNSLEPLDNIDAEDGADDE